jgi:hypothetical protein
VVRGDGRRIGRDRGNRRLGRNESCEGHELAAEFRLLASPAPTLPTPITPVVGDESALAPTDLEADRNQSRGVFLG